jgi:hypothetical protein
MPSGRSALFGSAAAARMDPDLVEVANFGEGWNIGPTVGINLPINPALMVTGSVGYTRRGSFDRERSVAEPDPALQAPTQVDPGDVLTGTATIAYQAAPWAWSLTGSISEETTTRENSADLFRTGRRYVGTGTLSYTWPANWGQSTATGSFSHTNRNDVKFVAMPALAQELINSNSNLYRVDLQHLFIVAQNFVIGPTGSFLRRDHNGYDSGTLQFVPAKRRIAAGGLARYAVNDRVTLILRGERLWIREDELPAPGGLQFSILADDFVAALGAPVVSSRGWVVSGGVNARF